MKIIESLTQKMERDELPRVALLFSCLFLIIVTYSILRPVRGAIVATELGSQSLPYLWAATAIIIGGIVVGYGRLVDSFPRQRVVMITTFGFLATLLLMRYLLTWQKPWLAGVFYIWGDVFSVVMVEQFWILANDLYDTDQAKRLYGIIGSGSVIGGISGSAVAVWLIKIIGTVNLIYVGAGLLVLLMALTRKIQTMGAKPPLKKSPKAAAPKTSNDLMSGFKMVAKERYIALILALVCLSQVIGNVIDYQFSAVVQSTYTTTDSRATFFGQLFFWVSVLSLFVNLAFTGPIQKHFGHLSGLLISPLMNLYGAALFLLMPAPAVIFGLRLFDKGLNYSIFRTSKEMLYIPLTAEQKCKAKAVIDMFGYRFSKIFGSLLIIPLVKVLEPKQLNIINMALMAAMGAVAFLAAKAYRQRQGLGAEAPLHWPRIPKTLTRLATTQSLR